MLGTNRRWFELDSNRIVRTSIESEFYHSNWANQANHSNWANQANESNHVCKRIRLKIYDSSGSSTQSVLTRWKSEPIRWARLWRWVADSVKTFVFTTIRIDSNQATANSESEFWERVRALVLVKYTVDKILLARFFIARTIISHIRNFRYKDKLANANMIPLFGGFTVYVSAINWFSQCTPLLEWFWQIFPEFESLEPSHIMISF